MKVQRLYIICDSYHNDPEAQNVCEGLFTKYRQRCEWITVQGFRPLMEIKPRQKGHGSGPFDHEVGAYAVFHAMGAASDTNKEFTHIALVESLQVALGDDFKKLGKLVLIACNLSYGPEMLKEHVHGKTVEEISAYKNGAGYLLLAMLRLNELGINPQIVGWDSYVSVLPHLPENGKRSIYTNPEEAKTKVQNPATTKVGSKIGRGLTGNQSYGLARGSYNDDHKLTYWIENGKVMIRGNKGWSDTK
jgi:hypothetical protein